MVDPFVQRARERAEKKNPDYGYGEREDTRSFAGKAKGAAAQYATGLAGGAGGIPGDVGDIIQGVAKALPRVKMLHAEEEIPPERRKTFQEKLNRAYDIRTGHGVPTPEEGQQEAVGLSEQSGIKDTEELTKAIQEDFDVHDPVNSLERILKESGQMGGQGAIIGAFGGPVGAAVGSGVGTAFGMLSASLKELGMPPILANIVAMLTPVAPIAAKSIVQKTLSASKAMQGAQKVAPGIPPTMATGREGPYAPGRSNLDVSEEALTHLQEPSPGQKTELEALKKTPVLEFSEEVPKGPSTVVALEEPHEEPIIAEHPPLTRQEHPASEVSRQRFETKASGGRTAESHIKTDSKKEKKLVRVLYDQAAQVYKNVSGIFPDLAESLSKTIEDFSLAAKPHKGGKAVLEEASAVLRLLEEAGGYKEVEISRLIKSSDSINELANHDMPFTGAREYLKKMSEEIDEAAIEKLKAKKIDPKYIQEANAAHAKFAEKYLNDEIAPFLKKTIRDPEKLFETTVKDEGTYRAVRDALADHPKELAKFDRHVVEDRLEPYVADPRKVGSEKFKDDMANLAELIGKANVAKVEKKAFELKRKFEQREAKVAERNAEVERQKAQIKATKESDKADAALHKIKMEKYNEGKAQAEKEKQRVLKYVEEKVEEHSKTPYSGMSKEALWEKLDKPTEIAKVREELTARGQLEVFNKLAETKTLDIMRGGSIGTGKFDLKTVVDRFSNKYNYEILKELHGKKAVDDLIIMCEGAIKTNTKREMMKKLAELPVKAVLNMTGLGMMAKALKIVLK